MLMADGMWVLRVGRGAEDLAACVHYASLGLLTDGCSASVPHSDAATKETLKAAHDARWDSCFPAYEVSAAEFEPSQATNAQQQL